MMPAGGGGGNGRTKVGGNGGPGNDMGGFGATAEKLVLPIPGNGGGAPNAGADGPAGRPVADGNGGGGSAGGAPKAGGATGNGGGPPPAGGATGVLLAPVAAEDDPGAAPNGCLGGIPCGMAPTAGCCCCCSAGATCGPILFASSLFQRE